MFLVVMVCVTYSSTQFSIKKFIYKIQQNEWYLENEREFGGVGTILSDLQL